MIASLVMNDDEIEKIAGILKEREAALEDEKKAQDNLDKVSKEEQAKIEAR
ncbi:hypothetical protein AGMMS49921_13790 [Endomicrobiia bacterium]|nr:hypothetical protein AGMMS49921_13790 [Endomicrobiia bacterium]